MANKAWLEPGTCETCLYWVEHGRREGGSDMYRNADGDCRKYPRWEAHRRLDWCWEHPDRRNTEERE